MSTILKMKNISKQFGGVYALDDVNLEIENNSIHALVGENGAGKSTLMNILSGIISCKEYSGSIEVFDQECRFFSIHDSESKGISIVHQELSLLPDLSIAENIFIGHEFKNKIAIINWEKTYKEAEKVMNRVGLSEKPTTLVKDLNPGKQQLVEIAKALAKDVKILILDEPTSSLNEANAKVLLDIIVELKKQGVTIIVISHKLSEIISVADNISILRDGKVIDSISNKQHNTEQSQIIPKMVGRELNELFPKRNFKPDDKVIFEVKDYSVLHPTLSQKKSADSINFVVHEKEIVGFYGLQGSGRTELALSLFGNSYGKKISGTVYLCEKKVDFRDKKQAINAGLAYVTEDRKTSGLMLDKSVKFNTTIANLKQLSNKISIIDRDQEIEVANNYVDKLNTKVSSIFQPAENLSGGNQQKVLLSKWLYTEPKVLIVDEPTRGIDVGAKYEIYKIMNKMVEEGRGIIVISSELPELLGICDRIYAMNNGKIVGEFSSETATQDSIMESIFQED